MALLCQFRRFERKDRCRQAVITKKGPQFGCGATQPVKDRLGVNLDPFYKLLWRHILTVEVLRTHFDKHKIKEDEGGIWRVLGDIFRDATRRDKSAKKAVLYLQQWGDKFWQETEYRVKEITGKIENKLSASLSANVKSHVLGTSGSAQGKTKLIEEETTEVLSRAQRVVSEVQIQDLDSVLEVLQRVLTDRQKIYYVLIDRLDES